MSGFLHIFGKTWWLILRTKGLKPIAIEPRRLPPSLAKPRYLVKCFCETKNCCPDYTKGFTPKYALTEKTLNY